MAKIIVIEGFDCAGKTICSEYLSVMLKSDHNYKVCQTSEPFGLEKLKGFKDQISHSSLSPMSEALIYIASRIEKIEYIKRMFQHYDYIIIDRFSYSTLVYQGAVCGVDTIKNISKLAGAELQVDLTILLDITYERFKDRVSKRQKKSKYEEQPEGVIKKSMEMYRAIATQNGDMIVPSVDTETTVNTCLSAILQLTTAH